MSQKMANQYVEGPVRIWTEWRSKNKDEPLLITLVSYAVMTAKGT